MTERVQFQAEIEKLVASHALHGSESLCKLLRYLARQAIDHPGIPVKEYQLATEVFGRQADFDPQLDSMVRVQAGRLRAKLAEYYNTEGATDRIVVELPKGSYAVAFHERPNPTTLPGNGHSTAGWASDPQSSAQPKTASGSLVRWLTLALIAAILAIAWLVWNGREREASAGGGSSVITAPAPLQIFWRGFGHGTEEPWVIFSNARFVGRPDVGMRYFNPEKDANSPTLDHYTGVGEVLAVHSLDIVFEELHQSLRVKRGSLFSLDDAKNNDLIFIGSPSENLTLLEIPSTREFVFKKIETGPRSGNVKIVNVHPQPNEQTIFVATPSNEALTDDYSVVAFVRAINPEHSELILAGTTTIGTQAAVEFVTRENYLEDLLKRLNVTQASELKPFEAVIHVKVARGVPVESSLMALRVLAEDH